ncbi:dTDP-4-dehydrorhamnose reductase [Flavobacteriaceae bacterium TP-CH-4]|uniref:dTDP-4-dehydrorhamnose reductase n=1 Tax=Pelagihabitans pacificus TaxID=2696054 RepID=A0A967ARR1_9FLAO|nr:dTDP-4-dehydrorhamnose reductase [Pelagihabitans pacificus]NHF59078.1 dTDP-4-dehydrorhamnose reductase [Pelagihabitans pacificus]
MKRVLVTGGQGQLATCIRDIAGDYPYYDFTFIDLDELDITDQMAVENYFDQNRMSVCVNCAAYTAVDKAEVENEMTEKVNVDGAKHLAEACKAQNAVFIQISTDFVFDGNSSSPYTEKDKTNPLSVYGLTKLAGEVATANALDNHYILRTSWLYSEHGNNFLKTMLRLGAEREQLGVVFDQIGTPTYAGDLAQLVLKIITEKVDAFGTYHFSNEGVASWYDFAKAIFDLSGTAVKLLPIKAEAYPTPARRPAFSVLDKSKIKAALNIEIPYWRDSLVTALKKIEEGNH